jgi:hypothetical protein
MTAQILVLAKAPVPGRVKTRLCPPCTPEEASAVAAAALADTLSTVSATPAARRTLAIDGDHPAPPGWHRVRQRGTGLGERLWHAFVDTALPGVPTVLIGMDTPQVTPELLATAVAGLRAGEAVLGPARDGGWWLLALRDPAVAAVLPGVPMSTSETGALTVAALREAGLRVGFAPQLRDVDTTDDATAVAAACPGGRFAAAVRRYVVPAAAR